MTRVASIRFLLIAAIASAWAVPLVRAFRLLSYAYGVEDGSINTGNDLAFSQFLILSYCFSFAVAATLAWLLPSPRAWLLTLPLAASLLIAFDVIRLHPESVIVFFPTMHPFRPTGLSLIVALTAALILWLRKKQGRVIRNAAQSDAKGMK